MNCNLKSVPKLILIFLFLVIESSFLYLDKSSAAEQVFIDLGNGAVGDTRTGLIWEKCGSKAPIMREDIDIYFKYSKTGGYEDWRLPTRSELIGLYKDLGIISSNHKNRCLEPFIWPTNYDCSSNIKPCKVQYWSSSNLLRLLFFSKDFGNGKNNFSTSGNTGKYIRAVRTTHLPDYMLSTDDSKSNSDNKLLKNDHIFGTYEIKNKGHGVEFVFKGTELFFPEGSNLISQAMIKGTGQLIQKMGNDYYLVSAGNVSSINDNTIILQLNNTTVSFQLNKNTKYCSETRSIRRKGIKPGELAIVVSPDNNQKVAISVRKGPLFVPMEDRSKGIDCDCTGKFWWHFW